MWKMLYYYVVLDFNAAADSRAILRGGHCNYYYIFFIIINNVFLRYVDDETSPKIQDPIDEKEYCYEILSKELKQREKFPAVAEILSKPLKQFKQSPAASTGS